MTDKEIKRLMWQNWEWIATDMTAICAEQGDAVHRDDVLDQIWSSNLYGELDDFDKETRDEILARVEKLAPEVFRTEEGPW